MKMQLIERTAALKQRKLQQLVVRNSAITTYHWMQQLLGVASGADSTLFLHE